MQVLLAGGGARLLLLAIARLSFCLGWGCGACPCDDCALCDPISATRDFEVFVFDVGGKTWKFYDWSQITTVATFGKYDPDLMCYAHSKGARVVLKGDISMKEIVSPAVRAAWIKQKTDLAKKQHMDGINIDIEQKVTFDVSWSPTCITYNRCYNYSGIADFCDFMFVMSYDEASQGWSKCIASANAPYKQTISGYDNYIHMGISPKKLVMGVPWYGYDYTCLGLSKAHVCSLAKIPFQLLPCSEANRHQVTYRIIMNWKNNSLSGILWDEKQNSPYLEYKDSNGTFHQVWFDDPRSISQKAAYVKERGLRGIGMWHANCLDYSRSSAAQEQTKAMWEALKSKQAIRK
ncbi:di-N-acetylchitobiase isoform X2 [Anolis carolinensis]|uniref:di-N-acetylchitobiase isoform X2 n=1 Tax=Anolis carolinensis TaxID=28377 RepID=UPI002F2B8545